MTPVELAASKRDFSVVWLKFLLRFQRDPMQEIWVFEGKDDLDYYVPRIDAHYGLSPATNIIVAEGKQNSLRLRDTLVKDAAYVDCKVAFFVDADFDDASALSGGNTYVTPCYSIENFYFSIDAVDRFLTDRLQLFEENDRSEVAKIRAHVHAWRTNAVTVLLPYCALMALAKQHGDTSKELASFLRDQLFQQVIALKRTRNGVETVAVLSPMDVKNSKMAAWNLNAAELDAQVTMWTEKWGPDLYKIVRGKFLIPCLGAILASLVEDSNKRRGNAFFSHRRPCSHQIRDAEILATLSRFADTPTCLVQFLRDLATRWRQPSETLVLGQ